MLIYRNFVPKTRCTLLCCHGAQPSSSCQRLNALEETHTETERGQNRRDVQNQLEGRNTHRANTLVSPLYLQIDIMHMKYINKCKHLWRKSCAHNKVYIYMYIYLSICKYIILRLMDLWFATCFACTRCVCKSARARMPGSIVRLRCLLCLHACCTKLFVYDKNLAAVSISLSHMGWKCVHIQYTFYSVGR